MISMFSSKDDQRDNDKWNNIKKRSTSPIISSSEDEYFTDEDGVDIDLNDIQISNYEDHQIHFEEQVDKINKTIENSSKKIPGKFNPIKILVSKQKRRFNMDGFNLDLTYVTERIIAMGFPAEKLESYYRNSMADVQKCGEKKYQYDLSCFNYMVGLFPSLDHQAPPLKTMFQFCEDLDKWLNEDKNHVAGIHCKAGKGRTGVMICCYLLYSKQFTKAYEALKYYGMIRTKNKKGVTIPSQIRYVNYFEKALSLGWNSKTILLKTIIITKIKLYTIPKFNLMGGCTPYFRLENNDREYDSKKDFPLKSYKSEAYIEFSGMTDLKVKGDVLIEFFNSSLLKKREKMFQFWFSTAFLDPEGIMTISKYMLEKAYKDKNHKKYNKDFKIELQYIFIDEDNMNNSSYSYGQNLNRNSKIHFVDKFSFQITKKKASLMKKV